MFELYLVYLDNNCVVEASEHVSASLQILCETEHSECIRQKFANPVVAGALTVAVRSEETRVVRKCGEVVTSELGLYGFRFAINNKNC